MRVALLANPAARAGAHTGAAPHAAELLRERGIRVALATDSRVETLSGGFPASEIVAIPSATPSGRSLIDRGAAFLHRPNFSLALLHRAL